MDAIYPFVGGTSASNSFNLKNPAAYQITWGGSMAFSSSGITGDGASGYGNTGFNPTTSGGNYSLNSASIGVFSQTNNLELSTVIGYAGPPNASIGFNGAQEQFNGLNSAAYTAGAGMATTKGFTAISLISGPTLTCYQTDGGGGPYTQQAATLPNGNLFVLALNSLGTPAHFSSKTLSFAFIGGGLTGTQVAALQTAVTTFNTALGR
jgi:hypothetical protein